MQLFYFSNELITLAGSISLSLTGAARSPLSRPQAAVAAFVCLCDASDASDASTDKKSLHLSEKKHKTFDAVPQNDSVDVTLKLNNRATHLMTNYLPQTSNSSKHSLL